MEPGDKPVLGGWGWGMDNSQGSTRDEELQAVVDFWEGEAVFSSAQGMGGGGMDNSVALPGLKSYRQFSVFSRNEPVTCPPVSSGQP